MSHLLNLDLIILFFFLGALASWLRSGLDFPEAISKFLSIFLLLSLGLKGGQEIRTAENLSGFASATAIGLLSCLIIPTYLYFWLRRKFSATNAAAFAACYGSVSAVTLITAQGLLENENIKSSGYMVAVMALMEIPAIVLALYYFKKSPESTGEIKSGDSVFAAKSVVLLLGGFIIGLMMNEQSFKSLAPVILDSFKGVLAFFLLDLGIEAQKQLKSAWHFRSTAILLACFLPLAHGSATLYLANLFGLSAGDQILLAVLAGSASYIAAPAAIRTSIPNANPSLYVALPLALTFPMNVLFGIPFYIELQQWL